MGCLVGANGNRVGIRRGERVSGQEKKSVRYQSPCSFSSHRSVVVDTLAQVLVRRVVSKTSEFVLNGLGKVRVFDD